MNEEELEKKKFFYSLIFPGSFVILMWLIKLSEIVLDESFANLGVYPMQTEGLTGIITGPLIHGDLGHLMTNTFPILILGTGLFYFYDSIAFKVFFIIYFLSGIMLWFGGREAYHIGASGLIYGLASFLFFSGIIRKHVRLMAFSLLVAFLYGGMIWGLLPIREGVSWEGHLFGAIAGVAIAFYYKDLGPQRKKYEWEIEEEMEEMNMDYYDWQIEQYLKEKERKGKYRRKK
ncbi:MAG: rhomboid family intramembrane serine protease [Bacteroidales bacterium]|nr:rhomboid family intramembrane serine protease [Bacteroidales bacterium]MBS3774680.1 rhomboid family intramembrane serine protease [Bacteroidales bacterium]